MAKKARKYKPGEIVINLNELYAQDFIFWRETLTPFGWFQNWQMTWAQRQINYRVIRKAIKIEEETK